MAMWTKQEARRSSIYAMVSRDIILKNRTIICNMFDIIRILAVNEICMMGDNETTGKSRVMSAGKYFQGASF